MSKTLSLQKILLKQIPIPDQLITHYKKIGLTEVELMVILQIYRFSYENIIFPTPEQLSDHMTIDEGECANILRRLIQNNYIKIEQVEDEQQRLTELYCLSPLWEKFIQTEKKNETDEENIGSLFVLFEQEFGRPLSPFEIEIINAWLDEDNISPSLIKAGLREAVLMGKLNFNYIDRILRDWKQKGIHTVEEARKSSRSFREHQRKNVRGQQKKSEKKGDPSIYYNWLEGEDA